MTVVKLSHSENSPDKRVMTPIEKRRRFRSTFMWTILTILVFMIVSLTTDYIPSSSMVPNLSPGDHIITLRAWIAYPFGAMPRRGDIITFHLPTSADSDKTNDVSGTASAATRNDASSNTAKPAYDLLIKRVIGLPGDVVQTDGNTVYINGRKLKETYPIVPVDLTEGMDYPYAVVEPLVVPPGHLFVLGDNRENSDDGRFWGTLQRSDVVGKYIGTLFHDDVPPTSKASDPPDQNADAAGK